MSLVLQKKLSFEELCPVWSKRTKEQNPAYNELLGIHSICVVGEAHKWKANDEEVWNTKTYFGCRECYIHGNRIFDSVYQGNSMQEIESFVDHWNESHL